MASGLTLASTPINPWLGAIALDWSMHQSTLHSYTHDMPRFYWKIVKSRQIFLLTELIVASLLTSSYDPYPLFVLNSFFFSLSSNFLCGILTNSFLNSREIILLHFLSLENKLSIKDTKLSWTTPLLLNHVALCRSIYSNIFHSKF